MGRAALGAGALRYARVRAAATPWPARALSTDGEPHSFSHAHFDTARNHDNEPPRDAGDEAAPKEHAVISMFDLFSIGIGPSSSHTVGPMRAGAIFVNDLRESQLLDKANKLKIALYGSLAATGKGHMTPQALLLGFEGADCETVDTEAVPTRYEAILRDKILTLGKDTDAYYGDAKAIRFDFEKDLEWKWGQTLPMHSNGMRFSVFDVNGDLIATNEFYSIGGGFVINGKMAVADVPGPRPMRESLEAPDGAEEPGLPHEAAPTTAVVPTDADTHPEDMLENVFYKSIRRDDAGGERRSGVTAHADETDLPPKLLSIGGDVEAEPDRPAPGQKEPRFPFHNMASLLALTRKHNLTIAQIVYENELTWYTPEEIDEKIMRIWSVMDEGIRAGVHSTQEVLPGSLQMKRRAPKLYRRLMRGLYMGPRRLGNMNGPDTDEIERPTGAGEVERLPKPQRDAPSVPAKYMRREAPRAPTIRGSFQHEIMPVPPRRTNFPAMDWLSCWAIATNEQVAAGGRIVIAPTLGAAGIIPAVLRYVVEFVALSPEDEENLVRTFLLTAAAIGMLFKRGATISAAEGGCMAEVGTSCSMAAAAFAACMGGSPEVIEQAAETAIEHNLGLTCDPVDGLVQAPCIERNAVGSVKAVVSANLALSSDGVHSISLDEAIHAARLTAADMHMKYKETRYVLLLTQPERPGHHGQDSRRGARVLACRCVLSVLLHDHGVFVRKAAGRRVCAAVWQCKRHAVVRHTGAGCAGRAGGAGGAVGLLVRQHRAVGRPVWPKARRERTGAERTGRADTEHRALWPAKAGVHWDVWAAGAAGRPVWAVGAGTAGPATGRPVWAVAAGAAEPGRPVWAGVAAGAGPAAGRPLWAGVAAGAGPAARRPLWPVYTTPARRPRAVGAPRAVRRALWPVEHTAQPAWRPLWPVDRRCEARRPLWRAARRSAKAVALWPVAASVLCAARADGPVNLRAAG